MYGEGFVAAVRTLMILIFIAGGVTVWVLPHVWHFLVRHIH